MKRITRTAGKPSRLSAPSNACGIAALVCPVVLGGIARPVDKGAMRSPDRRVAVLILVLGAVALGTAFGAQDYLGMAPCELCLWDRWPYRALILLGLVAFWLPPFPRRGLLWVAAFTLLCAAGVAFLHVGVEWHWWPSPLRGMQRRQSDGRERRQPDREPAGGARETLRRGRIS